MMIAGEADEGGERKAALVVNERREVNIVVWSR